MGEVVGEPVGDVGVVVGELVGDVGAAVGVDVGDVGAEDGDLVGPAWTCICSIVESQTDTPHHMHCTDPYTVLLKPYLD